ncbi:MAG: YggT family protein [Clostridiales bacterium]|nr:YggT family protein [Clostridiales bacterium]
MLYMIIINIVRGIRWFLNILSWLIIVNALLSWFMAPTHPVRSFLMRLIEPIVRPFRRLTSRLNTSGFPIDFSPLLAYFAILILLEVLRALESYLIRRLWFFG